MEPGNRRLERRRRIGSRAFGVGQFEVAQCLIRAGISLGAIQLQASANHQIERREFSQFAGPDGFVARRENPPLAERRERFQSRDAREHLEEHHSERIQIRAYIGGKAG